MASSYLAAFAVSRAICSTCVFTFAAYLAFDIAYYELSNNHIVITFLLCALAGLLTFFLAQLIMARKIKTVVKALPICAVLICTMALGFVTADTGIFGQYNKTPVKEDVKSVAISFDGISLFSNLIYTGNEYVKSTDSKDIDMVLKLYDEIKKEEKAAETIVKITKIEPNREQPRKVFNEDALQELADSIKDTVTLTIVNFIFTFVAIGLLGWLVLGMNPGISFMLGAALGGSSSAVAIPLVKQISIGEKSKTILILESAFSAILCIVVTLAIFESYKYGEIRIGIIFGQVFSSFLLASFIGVIGSIFWSMVLDKVRTINNSIFTTPAFVFIIYGINELLGYSGIISALAFGIGLANMETIHDRWLKKFSDRKPTLLNPTEKTLFSELVFLMKTFFFVYVGISIKFDSFISLLIGLGISFLLIILRIYVVRVSLPYGIKGINKKDRAFLSMMIPRGLAAAVLATMISQSQLTGSERVSNIVFSVIFFTIIVTSVLVPLLEKSEKFRYNLFTKLRREQQNICLAGLETKLAPSFCLELKLYQKNE